MHRVISKYVALKSLRTIGTSRALFILLAGEVESPEDVQEEIKELSRSHGTNVYVIGLPTADKPLVHLLGMLYEYKY